MWVQHDAARLQLYKDTAPMQHSCYVLTLLDIDDKFGHPR